MGLTFDGVDLEATYGLVVDGASSWPKPERDVEYIHVPGRSGDLLIDNGCWQNVEISYTFLIKDDWKTKFEDFAAWLCSHVGYFRLEDLDRHPGVYRMASFSGPIDPELWFVTDTGVFELTFNCKPQQWLLSGEEPKRFIWLKLGETVDLTGGNEDVYSASSLLPLKSGQKIQFLATPVSAGPERRIYFDIGNAKITRNGGSISVWSGSHGYAIRSTTGSTVSYEKTLTDSDFVYDGQSYPYICIGPFLDLSDDFANWNIELYIDGDQYLIVWVPVDEWQGTITVEDPGGYYNSYPLLKAWQGTWTINGFQIVYVDTSAVKPACYIDCETEDCYAYSGGSLVNKNDKVTITDTNSPPSSRDFPYLTPTENTISGSWNNDAEWFGYCGTIIVWPRWFRI